jgi:glutamate 5-kinase
MGAGVNGRNDLSQARRIVVKIGSRMLASDPEMIPRLATEIAALRAEKRSVVVVTSGAIAIGCHRLGYGARPKETARLQAAAAAGQSVLMRRYDEAFAALGVTTAQVLLTHADLADRERLNNARGALGALLEAGAVPIVNENDTVSTEEIYFGDNDQLAAMVAPLVTDVDGVLDPSGARISVMASDDSTKVLVSGAVRMGSGGIESKIDAARKACRAGASVVVAPAAISGILAAIVRGDDVGTLFPCVEAPLRARQHWIAYTLRPHGTLVIDAGATTAVRSGKASLLPVGVLGVRGEFEPGDAVRIVAPDGSEIGRGLTRLGALDAARAAGKKGRDLETVLGPNTADAVLIHKDDLVLA